jgi:hypothetical protein
MMFCPNAQLLCVLCGYFFDEFALRFVISCCILFKCFMCKLSIFMILFLSLSLMPFVVLTAEESVEVDGVSS